MSRRCRRRGSICSTPRRSSSRSTGSSWSCSPSSSSHGIRRVVLDAVGDLSLASPDAQRTHDYLYALVQQFAVAGITALFLLEDVSHGPMSGGRGRPGGARPPELHVRQPDPAGDAARETARPTDQRLQDPRQRARRWRASDDHQRPRRACRVDRTSCSAPRPETPSLILLRRLTALSRAVAQSGSLDGILDLAARQAADMLGGQPDDPDARRRRRAGPHPGVLWHGRVGGRRPVGRARRGADREAGARAGRGGHALVHGRSLDRPGRGDRAARRGPRRRQAPWTPLDEATLAAVADQSAAPIEIARLSEEVRQARLVQENARLYEAERAARAALDARARPPGHGARQHPGRGGAARGGDRLGHLRQSDCGPVCCRLPEPAAPDEV